MPPDRPWQPGDVVLYVGDDDRLRLSPRGEVVKAVRGGVHVRFHGMGVYKIAAGTVVAARECRVCGGNGYRNEKIQSLHESQDCPYCKGSGIERA